MSDRIIFTVKHKGECLAYLYQNWGMGDGPELDRLVREVAGKNGLDLTVRKDAIEAVRLAGEEFYGHSRWNGVGQADDPDDREFHEATRENREYLEAHPGEVVTDNQADGILFYYGTGNTYPDYIDGWCEDAYTMTIV